MLKSTLTMVIILDCSWAYNQIMVRVDPVLLLPVPLQCTSFLIKITAAFCLAFIDFAIDRIALQQIFMGIETVDRAVFQYDNAVGGRDVREYDLDTLRNEVSVVLQKNVLFSGTILENLQWGDEQAGEAEVRAAAAAAQADDFVSHFPEGYETQLAAESAAPARSFPNRWNR